MTKVFDNLISINSSLKSRIRINSDALSPKIDFVYNRYRNDETSVVDKGIKDRGQIDLVKNRFVRLSFDFSNLSNEEYNFNNFENDVYLLSITDYIDQATIKKFNEIDNFNAERNNLTVNLDMDESKHSLNYYLGNNIESKDYYAGLLKTSYKVSFNKGLNISNLLLQKDFPESDFSDHIDLYDELISSNNLGKIETLRAARENGILFPNVVKLSSNINTNQTLEDFRKKNAVLCGLLVKKFRKESSFTYTYLGGKFYTSKPGDIKLRIKNKIEDENVAYGKTYRYVVSKVYLYNWPDPDNHYITNKFLITDFPFITKDIDCIETKAPPPPREVNFKVNNDKKIKISWKFPKDYQEDGRGVQVLRRYSIDDPFTVIAQLEAHSVNDLYTKNEIILQENIITTPNKLPFKYIDKDYQPGRVTIYSLRLVDAHGLVSDYSTQTAVMFDPFEDKVIYDVISPEGAKRDKPNEKIKSKTLFFQNEVSVIDNLPFLQNVNKISLYVTPDFTKISRDNDSMMEVFKDSAKFKFTILKLNTLSKYEKEFNIENFNG